MNSLIYKKFTAPGFFLCVIMLATFLLDYKFVSKIGALEQYYVYILKAIPFFLFPLCLLSFRKSISTIEIFLILGFWFPYSFFGFFQTFSIDIYSEYFLSASWYFISSSIITMVVLRFKKPDELFKLMVSFMIFSGAVFFALQILTENGSNRFFDLPLILVIGILIFLRRHLILYLIICFVIFMSYFFSENRTGIVVAALCVISQTKLLHVLDGLASKLGALGLVLLLTLFYAEYEAIDLFSNSFLSGRGAIWSYWINILQSDPLFLLSGVRFTGAIYDSYVAVGSYQLAPILAYQFHSAFVATLVHGGLLCLLLSLCFILYMFLGSKGIGSSVFYYPLLPILSLNGVNDFFYPNVYGLTFLISILMCRRDEVINIPDSQLSNA